ncbi:uncharacterized protein LOC128270911 [Anopheles cruzii]|uniref:uncharacterized protein LOC128270911 n=1 Tax=Anopheles cruzii TaxID=68878 RepID=UPI0022EC58AD|nr:uncharacterized protein LOC128270911 [Anopheles cruzii]
MVALHGKFELFEQSLGKQLIDMDLRVRKYNRTESTLNGTIFIRQTVDDTLILNTDVFFSALGNQQFQHLPMHLPTSGFCQFMNHLHEEYPNVIKDIAHITEAEECPVSERAMIIIDKSFPSEVLPPKLTKGLWKMVVTGTIDSEEVLKYYLVARLFEDNYF